MKYTIRFKLIFNCWLLFMPLFFIVSAGSIQAASVVGQWGTGEYADVQVSGSIAACAAYGSGVDFFDISNPANPILLANFDTTYSCYKVFLSGSKAYAADGNAGLHIIDISTPANPVLLGTYDSNAAQDVFVVGTTAYVANAREGLLIFDVSNPEAPTLSGSFETVGSAEEIYVSGTTAYIIEQSTGIEIVDVSNPAAPALLSTRLNSRALGISVTGNIACFSMGWDGYELLDISNPAAPQLLASKKIKDSESTENGQIVGNQLYVVSTGAGLQIFDISDPTLPVLSGSIKTPETTREIAVNHSTAFIACDGGGLSIINVADAEAPTEIGKYDRSGRALSVWVDGTIAYLAKDEGNLQILDISNPQSPTRLGHFDHHSTCVQVVGNRAYVAGNRTYPNGEHKFRIADVSNPANPVEIGNCNLPGDYSMALQVVGSRAYIANNANGLMIIDISDPVNPSIIGNYSAGPGKYIKGLHISGTTAYLCCHSAGLYIVNISNPQAPTLIGFCDTPFYALDVDISGTRAYVADDWGGVQIIDITDPENPSITGTVELPDKSKHIQIVGDMVYVTLDENGSGSLRIIDISDPEKPELVESVDTTGAPVWVQVVNNRAFVAEGSSGKLLIVNLGAENSRNIYFPHAACADGWSTEIALINTGTIEAQGDLVAYNDLGEQVGSTKNISLRARGRDFVGVDYSFADSNRIAYLIFKTGSQAPLVGYTKFYHSGTGYRVALPTTAVNNTTFNVSHIASDENWWTGIALLNTNSTPKNLTVTFSDGQSKNIALAANEHKSVSIRDLFVGAAQPQIDSAIITNCAGVIGFELFGSIGDGRQLSGITLSGKTENTIYFPHISSLDGWWTGLAAYDPTGINRTLSITPYAQDGTELLPIEIAIPVGSKKYLNSATAMGLPENAAWVKISATSGITGFELFGNNEKNWLAGYTGVGLKSNRGIFATLENDSGWTGLALVNSEAETATVTLRARNNRGELKARKDLTLAPHERLMGLTGAIFTGEDLSKADYISYESNRELVGFQINNNGRMLDALPALKY